MRLKQAGRQQRDDQVRFIVACILCPGLVLHANAGSIVEVILRRCPAHLIPFTRPSGGPNLRRGMRNLPAAADNFPEAIA